MSRALLVLDSDFQRRKAADWCWSLKPGTRVEFKAPQRSDDQNSKMWAMLTEISVQLKWHGIKLTPDDWKLQFLDALRRAHGEQVRVVPNTDNSGFVNLGTSSSDLSKDEMSDLIELIYKFGAEHDVKFNDPHSSSAGSSPADQGSDSEAPSSGQTVAADNTAEQAVEEEGAPELSEPEKADHGGQPAPSSTYTRADCVRAFMATATDAALDVTERRYLLEQTKEWWKESLPDDLDFVRACLQTSDKVCKGELIADAARKFLEALP